MAKIINGRHQADLLLKEIESDVKDFLNTYGITVRLVVIQIGDSYASNLYVSNKLKKAKKVGIVCEVIKLNLDVTEGEVLQQIYLLNDDKKVHGIIVQLPIPVHLNYYKVIEAINPKKDVDGFHPLNVGYLHSGKKTGFVPCTPLGCMHLLNGYFAEKNDKMSGKNAVMIGRSNIVGKPLASLLTWANCTVTICHSYTQNLSHYTRNADILVSAVGQPGFLNQSFFSKKSVVIDIGINWIFDNKLVGDVVFDQVLEIVEAITPVPGGVGPMTVAYLMKNTLKAAQLQLA